MSDDLSDEAVAAYIARAIRAWAAAELENGEIRFQLATPPLQGIRVDAAWCEAQRRAIAELRRK